MALMATSHIALGISIGLLASFIQSLGLTIQRKSHVLNESLPEEQQRVEHRRPLWLLGFAIFISSNIVGSLVQIASLPVVILAPLGAVSLLWNAFFARLLLGDVFSPWMVLGTLFIACGAILIAIFGIVPEPTRSLEDLLALFRRPTFVVYFSLLGAVVLGCLIITHISEYSFSRRLARNHVRPASPLPSSAPLNVPENPSTLTTGMTNIITEAITTERTPLLDRKSNLSTTSVASSRSPSLSPRHPDAPEMRSINRTRLTLAISYASISGIISGMCLLFAKSGVELLLFTLGGNNQFWRWQAWVLVVGLVAFALLQLWYLHKALILADPTLVCPSAFCFYNLSSIVNGLVYFDQFSLIPPLHLGLVILGIFVLLGGVWVVSVQSGSGGGEDTWSDEESVEGIISDLDPEAQYVECDPLVTIGEDASGRGQEEARPSLARSTRSESNLDVLSASPERSLRSPLSTVSQLLPSLNSQPTLRQGISSRRRSHHQRAQTSAYPSSPPAPNPLATLGGFQIGLSPVSPGFAIVPRERGRIASGLNTSYNFVDIVEQRRRETERRRRRTVSEGDVRTRAAALERAEVLSLPEDEADGETRTTSAKARWRWLSTLVGR
ncbi:hypothetical protein DFH07DRAFT_789090 [Mycena maculata]|uniref:DUF803 domain-containing protein n=1 Tax=Mycena maculata TaxID=230809 RepID=A0AAD7KIF8_9AGAR|nr:hypothetical protein DFH07DRAFT_789090 [Mycena maculata]